MHQTLTFILVLFLCLYEIGHQSCDQSLQPQAYWLAVCSICVLLVHIEDRVNIGNSQKKNNKDK